MLKLALVFFIMAALLGLFLASFLLRKLDTPKAVSILHGLFAATGLVILIITASIYPQWLLWLSVIVFVMAAMGGGLVLYKDLTGKSVPVALILMHASGALIGICLVIYVFLHR